MHLCSLCNYDTMVASSYHHLRVHELYRVFMKECNTLIEVTFNSGLKYDIVKCDAVVRQILSG